MRTDDFKSVKEQVGIVPIIEQHTGQKFKKIGTTLNLPSCPFCGGHECFRLPVDAQWVKCFQCDFSGDVFTFIERVRDCQPKEALKYLADQIGYTLSGDNGCKAPEKVDRLAEIRQMAAGYYHEALFSNRSALAYQTEKRGHSQATLKMFQVGLTDGRLSAFLSSRGFTKEEMMRSGLVVEKDGRSRDFFSSGVYIYPHKDRGNKKVSHFTIKDPNGKLKYQLGNAHRDPEHRFFNQAALREDSIILVEGENDLLSVAGKGKCAGVLACCGQISEDQVNHLMAQTSGKRLYLCFDSDQAGERYTQKIQRAFLDAELCFPEALLKLQRKSGVDLCIIRFNPKFKDIDEYLRAQSDPEEAMQTLIAGAERILAPLKSSIRAYSQWCEANERKYSYDDEGRIYFDWFKAKGQFFVDDPECYLYYGSTIYHIGNNTAFKALLYGLTGLNAASNGARLVWQSIESQAYLSGCHTSVPGWIHTDIKANTIYFNLCNPRNEILKISPGKIETLLNGTNPERVLLRNSPKMERIEYLPEANVKEGMARLKELFFDNLACDLADRYFVLCILLNTPLIKYAKARGITKFSGTAESGKTTAASLMSILIYGADWVMIGTAASDFSEAMISPLTIADNLESEGVRGEKKNFLLTASTGVTRQKRKGGTDSQNAYEKACTQLVLTSIEPFTELELIKRCNDIEFDKVYFRFGYPEAMTLEAGLVESRNLIWSSFFKILSESILPGLEEKKAAALKRIQESYSNHSKSRLNELYAMLYIILGEVVKYIPHPGYSKDPFKKEHQELAIMHDWVKNQEARARETEANTNKIIHRLEALLKEYLHREDGFPKHYIDVSPLKNEFNELATVTFTASSRDLYMAFDWLSKERGISNPFQSTSQLGARMTDSA